MTHTQHDPRGPRQRASDELVPEVARELASALASLRAALEGLARDFEEGDPRLERMQRAVGQTLPIARQVEALADCTASTPLQEMTCSMREIAVAVRAALGGTGSGRLILALEDALARFRVDGPLLVRALVLLGEELGEEEGGHVLLRTRLERGEPSFSLSWPCAREKHERLSLSRRLLGHEARRLGARFEEGFEGGCARVELHFPAATREEVAR
ncbi:MAG: hypothetical protein IPJ19_05580 [Planctomycetes bacterium]|nr:hypothetical protein [Planctomycetota bacterium]